VAAYAFIESRQHRAEHDPAAHGRHRIVLRSALPPREHGAAPTRSVPSEHRLEAADLTERQLPERWRADVGQRFADALRSRNERRSRAPEQSARTKSGRASRGATRAPTGVIPL